MNFECFHSKILHTRKKTSDWLNEKSRHYIVCVNENFQEHKKKFFKIPLYVQKYQRMHSIWKEKSPMFLLNTIGSTAVWRITLSMYTTSLEMVNSGSASFLPDSKLRTPAKDLRVLTSNE